MRFKQRREGDEKRSSLDQNFLRSYYYCYGVFFITTVAVVSGEHEESPCLMVGNHIVSKRPLRRLNISVFCSVDDETVRRQQSDQRRETHIH